MATHREPDGGGASQNEGDADMVGVLFADVGGNIRDANDAFLRMVGYTREHLHAGEVRWDELTPPEYRDRDAQSVAQIRARGAAAPFEKEYVRRDGSRVPVLIGASLLPGSEKDLIALVIDLTRSKRVDAERTLMSESLRSREAQLEDILDNTAAIVYVQDLEGRYQLINRRFETVHHRERQAVLGKTDHDLFPPEMAEASRAVAKKVLESGEPQESEVVAPQEDGLHTYIVSTFPLRDAAGSVYALCGVSGDITERKRAERRMGVQYGVGRLLAEADTWEDVAPSLLQTIGEGFEWGMGVLWTVDPQEEALRCQRIWHRPGLDAPELDAACRETRFRRGAGLPGHVWETGKTHWSVDVLQQPDFHRVRGAAAAGLHGALVFPIRGFGESGGILGVVEFFSREIRPPDYDMLQIMTSLGSQFGQFIERKRAEAALRSSEARKAAVLETVLDCIITIDRDGRVVEWNRAAERTFGYTEAEVMGRDMADFIIPPRMRHAHHAGLAGFLVTGEGPLMGNRVEVSAVRRDGEEFPVELTITRIPRDGAPVLFTGTLRDITERRRTEEALAAAHERARHVADSLERSLLLRVPEDEFPGVSLATIYEAAWDESMVGGDFFDAFSFGDGKVALVVGDATGKGLTAGIRTAEIKFVLRAFLRESPDPASALARLNDFLCDAQKVSYHDRESFIVLALVVMDTASGETIFTVAGAEAPLLLRADGSGEMVNAGGLPLGIAPGQDYETETLRLEAGDTILLATDGITEARQTTEAFLGNEGLLEMATQAAGGSVRQIGQAILERSRAFAGGALQDDVCILVARRR